MFYIIQVALETFTQLPLTSQQHIRHPAFLAVIGKRKSCSMLIEELIIKSSIYFKPKTDKFILYLSLKAYICVIILSLKTYEKHEKTVDSVPNR